jgi:hypothetical protein
MAINMKKIKLLIGLFIALAIGSNIYAQGDFIMSYNTSLSLGETNDFISQYSWRGFGMEGRWEVADEIYIGVSAAWSVFYEAEKGTFVNGTRTTSATQYKYINAYPLLAAGYKYFTLTSRGLSLYGGLGLGTYYVETIRDFSIWTITNKGWQFGVAPEIGILIPGTSNADFILSVKYNYALKTSKVPEFSTLGFNIGISY